MTHIFSTASELAVKGAIVEVALQQGRGARQSLPSVSTPAPIPVSALIDTGASATAVQTGLCRRLGLHPIGVTNVRTPASHIEEVYRYSIQLLFSNGNRVECVAIEVPLLGQHIQCLIGRDLLKQAVFIYSGPNDSFSLSF